MAVLQDLINEINALKDSQKEVETRLQQENLQQDNVQELQHRLALMEVKTPTKGDVDNLQTEHQCVQNKLKELEDRLAMFPSAEELNNMVQWETLHETLVRRPVTADAHTSYTLLIDQSSPTSKTSVVESKASQTMVEELTPAASMALPQAERQIEAPTSDQTPAQASIAATFQSSNDTHKVLEVNGEEGASIASQASQQPMEEPRAQHVTQDLAHPPASPEDGYSSFTTTSVDGTQIPGLHPTTSKLRLSGESDPASPVTASYPGTPNKATPPDTPSSSPCSRASHRFADTVKALRNIGCLTDKHALLQAKVEAMETVKADKTEVSMLESNTASNLRMLCELQEKLSSLYTDIQEMKGNADSSVTSEGKDLLQQLDKTTGSICQSQQERIEDIYQILEKLEEKKADKEHVELKQADVLAMEGKVSRSQFDATTEQINAMMQELLSKVSDQEQDWQRVLEKINLEMQSKLDRMELDPLKNKLEERWKEIRQRLQDKPPQFECNDAAGIRRQLFRCLSCDRPVDMAVPGPPILTIPNIPGLPPHPSNRPFIVYKLDQIRQCSRSDRMADLADLGRIPNNRSCGGAHTMTRSNQRYARMQGVAPEEDLPRLGVKEGFDILGSDGQIYKGRVDCSLPTIPAREGRSKHGRRRGSPKSLMSDASVPSSRPQSAKSYASYRRPALDAHISSLT